MASSAWFGATGIDGFRDDGGGDDRTSGKLGLGFPGAGEIGEGRERARAA